MSHDEREAIRHTVGHLVGLAIDEVGSVREPASEQDRKDAAKVRDAVRATGNLVQGLLCDLNRIADANDVMASPPPETVSLVDGKVYGVEDLSEEALAAFRQALGVAGDDPE